MGGILWTELQRRATARAARVAVVTAQGELTFGAMFEEADRLARALTAAGVREGDLVALALPNVLEFPVALLALLRVSASVALLSTKYGTSECDAIVASLGPRAVVTSASGLPLASLGSARTVALDAAVGRTPLVLAFPGASTARPHRAAILKLTSGSTGTPKAVALTAENVIAEAENVTATLALSPQDRIVAPVPLFHSYGFDVGLLAALWSGASLLARDMFVPRQTWRDLASPTTSLFLGVPAMYRFLLEAAPDAVSLEHVRYLLSCTAPLPDTLIARFADRCGAALCQHYGSSETGAAANHVPDAVLERPGSVGLAMANVKIRIVDGEGHALGPGQEGEVVVESAAVAAGGYAMGGPPPSDRVALAAPIFRTGDLGCLDDDGFLFVRGRRDDVINVGGMKVYPLEVARVLESHPDVVEAAVAPMRDGGGEEAVYAAVAIGRSTVTATDLAAYCRGKLADYRVPRRIDLFDALPRGPTGKVRITAPGRDGRDDSRPGGDGR